MTGRIIRVFTSVLLLIICGCASTNSVTFVTKTSLGLDVDSTPPGVSFAYDRVEGYIAPRYENGAVPAVAGSIVTDGGTLGRNVRQFYSTGQAALKLTDDSNVTPPKVLLEGKRKTMFFGTTTTLGVKFAFNPTGIDGFNLGYKRKEFSYIPVGQIEENGKTVDTYPSVLGVLDTGVEASTLADSKIGVSQLFATGAAAEKLAELPILRARFKSLATDALSQYRVDERQQQRFALNTLSCLAKIPDAKVGSVWENAAVLKLFDAGIADKLKAATPGDARKLYTSEIGLIRADSSEYTGRMAGHQAHVCEIAKSST